MRPSGETSVETSGCDLGVRPLGAASGCGRGVRPEVRPQGTTPGYIFFSLSLTSLSPPPSLSLCPPNPKLRTSSPIPQTKKIIKKMKRVSAYGPRLCLASSASPRPWGTPTMTSSLLTPSTTQPTPDKPGAKKSKKENSDKHFLLPTDKHFLPPTSKRFLAGKPIILHFLADTRVWATPTDKHFLAEKQ